MKNLKLHALFQAEEEALQQAFIFHDLTNDNLGQWRLREPALLRDVFEFPDDILCQKLRGHIDAGVDVNATSDHTRMTAFRSCFRDGKMASMRLLLGAGAQTSWTPDQVSLALGKIPETPQTGEMDPFCFACRVGNIAAAQDYVAKFDTGHGKNSDAVIAAVKARATNVLKWLMDLGFDPNAVDGTGWDALERAVSNEDLATAEVLLAAGAAPFGSQKRSYTSPVEKAVSNEMRRLFVKHGVNPSNFNYGPSLVSPNLARLPTVTLTKSAFEAHRTNRAGRSNPERFLPSFWSEQMRDGRYSTLKSLGYAPDRDKPVWSFGRYGRTATLLPDGRLIFVAGEHEDHYDADFCIYADVTVMGNDGSVDHFIYPENVFPPTDFHTATLVKDEIWLIGSLGYPEHRKDGQTQVLRLNTIDFSVTPVRTSGPAPGWIHKHRATLTTNGIFITGGKVEPDYQNNDATYLLNLETLVWQDVSGSTHS